MYLIGDAELEALRRVVHSGRLFRYPIDGGGPTETEMLEREFASMFECKNALAVTNGTAALICALIGSDVHPGDEVIIPGYTFIATALAPLAIGAIPVLVDIDATMTLDTTAVARACTARTKAIIVVHMNGHIADLGGLGEIARRKEIALIEDCCQAIGGAYQGRPVGSMGDAGAFSFNFYKTISAGEGGMLVTRRRLAYQRARIYHDVGTAFFGKQKFNRDAKGVVPFAGANYRIDELRSAVLRVQLTRLPEISVNLRQRWKHLRLRLTGFEDFDPIPLHETDGNCGSVLLVRFESEARARSFLTAAQNRLPVLYPYESRPHVYASWDPLMQRRGAYHPDWDPLRVTEAGRAQSYSPEMLPMTLNHLKATVGVSIDPKWSDEETELIAQRFGAIAASAHGVVVGGNLSTLRSHVHAARVAPAKISRRGASILRSVIRRAISAVRR
jgi:dTDP-4-amino-4,6-dideoxygalactose transaminase